MRNNRFYGNEVNEQEVDSGSDSEVELSDSSEDSSPIGSESSCTKEHSRRFSKTIIEVVNEDLIKAALPLKQKSFNVYTCSFHFRFPFANVLNYFLLHSRMVLNATSIRSPGGAYKYIPFPWFGVGREGRAGRWYGG